MNGCSKFFDVPSPDLDFCSNHCHLEQTLPSGPSIRAIQYRPETHITSMPPEKCKHEEDKTFSDHCPKEKKSKILQKEDSAGKSSSPKKTTSMDNLSGPEDGSMNETNTPPTAIKLRSSKEKAQELEESGYASANTSDHGISKKPRLIVTTSFTKKSSIPEDKQNEKETNIAASKAKRKQSEAETDEATTSESKLQCSKDRTKTKARLEALFEEYITEANSTAEPGPRRSIRHLFLDVVPQSNFHHPDGDPYGGLRARDGGPPILPYRTDWEESNCRDEPVEGQVELPPYEFREGNRPWSPALYKMFRKILQPPEETTKNTLTKGKKSVDETEEDGHVPKKSSSKSAPAAGNARQTRTAKSPEKKEAVTGNQKDPTKKYSPEQKSLPKVKSRQAQPVKVTNGDISKKSPLEKMSPAKAKVNQSQPSKGTGKAAPAKNSEADEPKPSLPEKKSQVKIKISQAQPSKVAKPAPPAKATREDAPKKSPPKRKSPVADEENQANPPKSSPPQRKLPSENNEDQAKPPKKKAKRGAARGQAVQCAGTLKNGDPCQNLHYPESPDDRFCVKHKGQAKP